ncbi:MAG TPA: YqgE/AlgH family protein [Woeseiaceae bacterium]|nr:YqgE/AlgH family protein [Woeseiaceae bacterium]
MTSAGALHNQLLVAMPGMADPNFADTVTLICEYNDAGALGIVVNRPMTLTLGDLLEQLDVHVSNPAVAALPVLDGGPVGRERGFVLHSPGSRYESTVAVSGDIQLTLSKDVLDALAAGGGPRRALVALGYAGWEAGQLEAEIRANTWLNVPATPEILFDVPFADRWLVATRSLGIHPSQLSSDAGHA